jgi:hypothetical protein
MQNYERFELLMAVTMKSTLTPYGLIYKKVSEAHAASIYRVVDGGNSFLGNIAKNLPDYRA